MSQNNVWRFHQIRKIGLEKHEKNKLPPEEEVGLEAREKVTQQALQGQPQEQGEIPARRRPRVHSSPGLRHV